MVVLAKLRKVSTRFALSLTAALIPGLASGGSDLASLHLGLAQFALDTHDPAAALRYTGMPLPKPNAWFALKHC